MKTPRLLLPAEEEMLEAAFYYEQQSNLKRYWSLRSCICADIRPTGLKEHPDRRQTRYEPPAEGECDLWENEQVWPDR